MELNQNKVIEFLRESNAIEGVYDDDSLSQAIAAWNYLIEQDALTVGVVLKTHKILMLNQRGLKPDQKGYFRTIDVWVAGYKAVNPTSVPFLMSEWCDKVMTDPKMAPTPINLHVEYENIHPFVDGNGRTGRMFLNWQRVKRLGYDIIIIKESERRDYYKWFA